MQILFGKYFGTIVIEINFIKFKIQFINCIDSVTNVKTKLLFQEFKIYSFEPPKGGATPRNFLLRLSTYFTTNFLECLDTFPVWKSLFGNEQTIQYQCIFTFTILQRCYHYNKIYIVQLLYNLYTIFVKYDNNKYSHCYIICNIFMSIGQDIK